MCILSYLPLGEGTSLLGSSPESPKQVPCNYVGNSKGEKEFTTKGGRGWSRLQDVAFGFALCALFLAIKDQRLPFSTNIIYSLPANEERGGDPVVDLKGPPMGFMSWERFRCQIDCEKFPDSCIHENLYVSTAKALVEGGYAEVGYRSVNIDDCWTDKRNGRDANGKLQADRNRFPHGIAWLADYMHSHGLSLGIYADVGMETCARYAGSQGHEEIDAQTFADWGVDYLKLDGCNVHDEKYSQVYTKFGNAIKAAARTKPMVLSCSWPAYIGDNEGDKPFQEMYHQSGCNTWRNYVDIDNAWHSLYKIIMHWADYWKNLHDIPDGSYNDADMLLVGDDHYGTVLPVTQAKLQMGFWAMIASPLFIGGDIRTITNEYRAILLNSHVIAINQDPSRKQAACVMGCRGTTLTTSSPIQVWSKSLQYGESRALAFLNIGKSVTNISYNYTVEGVIARCVDLWGDDPSKDICNQGQGAVTNEWKTERLSDHKIQIQARHVGPTSHRLLRIDYMCDNEDDDKVDHNLR